MAGKVTKAQIADAAIIYKTAQDVFDSTDVAYDSGEIDRETYHEQITAAGDDLDAARRAFIDVIDAFEEQCGQASR